MSRISFVIGFGLLALTSGASPALAQTTKAAEAARLQKLKAQQAAVLAAAHAKQAAAAATTTTTTTPTPTATNTRPIVVVTPPPTATAAATTATAAPKTSATPVTSGSAKPATSAAPATSGSAAAALATHAETASIALDLDALKKSRPDRRHAEFLDLQSRWGNLLSDPRATAELTQHSQRIAYLQRIRGLGSKAKDETFVKGVDALITKEETRDSDALNALRSGALPAPAVPAAVLAPATTPAPGASK